MVSILLTPSRSSPPHPPHRYCCVSQHINTSSSSSSSCPFPPYLPPHTFYVPLQFSPFKKNKLHFIQSYILLIFKFSEIKIDARVVSFSLHPYFFWHRLLFWSLSQLCLWYLDCRIQILFLEVMFIVFYTKILTSKFYLHRLVSTRFGSTKGA